MKKTAAMILLCLSLLLGLASGAFAVEVKSEHEYKPLDLVIVLDNSGSMKYSDLEKTALSAVRMLVNMMPAEDSRVCVIGFNTDPIPLTKDGSGKATLIPLKEFSGVETIREAVKADNVPYKGDTGIGNALNAAREVLSARSDPAHDHAIILFTDGVDDFETTHPEQLRQTRLAACEENEANTVQWARKDQCPIYSLGYNYEMSNGEHSMGPNGEGLVKLKNIAEMTGGQFRAIESIRDMELMMIQFLADVCDLVYQEVITLPGDGGEHSCSINVSSGVVEANIRIAGGDANAISNGEILLTDPDDKEIPLTNSGNIRFDVDIGAASIKMIMPKSGEWKLTIKGIRGEEIHVGLLEHYRMNLSTEITFPPGNPEGVAFTNDELGVRAWLTYDGKDLADDDLYDAVTSAKVILVSRKDPNDRKEFPLTLGSREFTGSIVIPSDNVYDAIIRLDWNSVYREDTIPIYSSNRPLELTGEIGDVKVQKNKSVTVDNIFQFVRDDENDPITAEIASVTNADKADVAVSGDRLTVTGKKHGSTMVTVRFTDDQGNSVESDFKLKVIDPLVIAGVAGIIALAVGIIIAALLAIRRANRRLSGCMRVVQISRGTMDKERSFLASEVIYENPKIQHTIVKAPKTPPAILGQSGFGANQGGPLGSQSAFGAGADQAQGQLSGGFNLNTSIFIKTDGKGNTGGGQFTLDDGKKSDTDTSKPKPVGGILGDEEDPAKAQAREQERKHSERFNTPVTIGGGKSRHKQRLNEILSQFLTYYQEHMRTFGPDTARAKRVNEVLEGMLPLLSRILLKDTGKRTTTEVRVDKKTLQTALRVHSPELSAKGKGSISCKERPARLLISIPEGQPADGATPCIYLEIEYSKS